MVHFPKLAIPEARRNEMELVLQALSFRLNTDLAESLSEQAAGKNMDWEFVIQTALKHEIVPLIYKSLEKIAENAISAAILEKMRNYYLFNTKKNILLCTHLVKILDLLERNEIGVVPFKGPVLAEAVYGGLQLRTFADTDLLVSTRDAVKAFEILTANGYRPLIQINQGQFKKYVQTKGSLEFIDEKSQYVVDLHWELSGGYSMVPVEFKDVSGNLDKISLLDKQVNRLSDEDTLLSMCFHGLKDEWNKLERLFCLAELLHKKRCMNWTRITGFMETFHCERVIMLGLSLSKRIFSIDLPAEIISRFRADPVSGELGSNMCRKLFDKPVPSSPKMGWRFSSIHIKARDNCFDKIKYCVILLVRPSAEEWRVLALPEKLAFLYYVLRPIRLSYVFIKWTASRMKIYV